MTISISKVSNHITISILKVKDNLGGSSIFVKSCLPQRELKIKTQLQAVAVSVTLDKETTICSVYIPPAFSLTTEYLQSLLSQLPAPCILVGDFNGHNTFWDVKIITVEETLKQSFLDE